MKKLWSKGAMVLAVAVCLQPWGDEPLYAQAQDVGQLAGAISTLRDTVRQGFSDVTTRLDRLLAPKWEYKTFTPNVLTTKSGQPQTAPDFAGLGRDGWELAAYDHNIGYIFKRLAK
jgi:hypothetical protein